jgi:hypothetical protein
VLFIAESPPAFCPGSEPSYFFFEENPGGDLLFATIVEAALPIKKYQKRSCNKRELLRYFQENGFWLIDAVEYPINKINGERTSSSIRKEHIEKGRAELLARVASLNAKNGGTDIAIVLIKNLVYECLLEPLRQAGYCVPQDGPIGFPRWHGDPNTIRGIKSAIAKHSIT